MTNLFAEQTCQIDDTELQSRKLTRGGAHTDDCENVGVLYAGDECLLQCEDGWYQTQTPKITCADNTAARTSASGTPSYTGRCESTWYIFNGSHNGNGCRIGDLLLRCFDS